MVVAAFPSPVLSVAADVVRDLDGRDALTGLWTLFTKCKESLQDGPRLENISWRLWHRELCAGAARRKRPRHHHDPPSAHPLSNFSSLNAAPLSPISDSGHPPPSVGQDCSTSFATDTIYPQSPASSTSRAVSSNCGSSSVAVRKPSSPIGKFILDMLPGNKLMVSPPAIRPPSMSVAPLPEPTIVSPKSALLTPELEIPSETTNVAGPFPSVVVPTLVTQLGSSVSLTFPRVVIVNPTPHPTPPATPAPVPTTLANAPPQTHSHLLPPPRLPAAVQARNAPSSASGATQQTRPSQAAVSVSATAATTSSAAKPAASASSSAAPIPTPPVPKPDVNGTVKPVDRRFFLQQSNSPSSECGDVASSHGSSSQGRSDSLKRNASIISDRSPSEAGSALDAAASSVTSNKTSASASSRRAAHHHHQHHHRAHQYHTGASRARFGQRAHPLVQRKAAGTEAQHKGHSKAVFDVGSVTSDGSRATTSSQRRPSEGSGSSAPPRAGNAKARSPSAHRAAETRLSASASLRSAGTRLGSTNAPNGRIPVQAQQQPPVQPRRQEQPQQQQTLPQLSRQLGQQQEQRPRPTVARSTTVPNADPASRRGVVVSEDDDEMTDTDSGGSSDDWEDDDDDDIEDGEDGSGAHVAVNAEDMRLREAALEAQRQRELFDKLPKRSYSNLGRTQSGLLSQLLNPDPTVLPPGHPLRSSSVADVHRVHSGHAPAYGAIGRGPGPTHALATSYSATALPQLSAVNAQAPHAPTDGRYRPRGRPAEQELEDESSESESEVGSGVSRSIAQQRLAALTDPNRRRRSETSVPAATPPQPPPPPPSSSESERPTLMSIATAPIPLNHPWNLPPAAPPMTPRTTRRQMLSTELSESLRRNLLWERQVSKMNLLRGGLRPLTQARQGANNVNGTAGVGPNGAAQGRAAAELQRTETEEEKRQRERAERRRAALARHRSWADDYHYAGW